jgi:hypothetical protein
VSGSKKEPKSDMDWAKVRKEAQKKAEDLLKNRQKAAKK